LTVAKSNKPLVWAPFAAGGTLTAFLTPVLVLLTLLVALGRAPELLSYERLHDFASNWLAKSAIIVVVFLSLWSAAHRLRITCYDFGVRADTLVATVVYVVAGLGTIATAVYLCAI
jgi:fumarate reductase subunit D